MRSVLGFAVAFVVFAACTGSGDNTPAPEPSVESNPTPKPTTVVSLWTGDAVISDIAAQLFAEESRPVHIFGLNVEEGEEFVPSGRDVLPLPPNTEGWRAEFDGDGVWIVDTGALIYRFVEADMSFDVIYEYGSE